MLSKERTLIVIMSGEFVTERLASVSCAEAKCQWS